MSRPFGPSSCVPHHWPFVNILVCVMWFVLQLCSRSTCIWVASGAGNWVVPQLCPPSFAKCELSGWSNRCAPHLDYPVIVMYVCVCAPLLYMFQFSCSPTVFLSNGQMGILGDMQQHPHKCCCHECPALMLYSPSFVPWSYYYRGLLMIWSPALFPNMCQMYVFGGCNCPFIQLRPPTLAIDI